MSTEVINHFHLFCGLGGGAAGFNRSSARVGQLEADFRCIGAIDVDAAALEDFRRLVGRPGTLLDLFDRQQYIDWHGHEPPEGWREAGPEEIRRAAGGERPNIIFTSAPCKGFSGLLSPSKSATLRYQALNRLTLRGVWLALEAWADDPAEFILFENVPLIQSRGRHLLDQIVALLEHYGYAGAETVHDCGEIGGLAQSRKRFLLVARHREKVPPFLFEPPKRPLRSVGEVIGDIPMPGDPAVGPMHRVPALAWKTWLRLALIPAGRDWRALQELDVRDGVLAEYALVPEAGYHRDALGVLPWAQHSGTVTGGGRPAQGAFSVADPRLCGWSPYASCNKYRIIRWDQAAGTVIGARGPADGAASVADPRGGDFPGKYRVTPYDHHATTVISGSTTGQGAFAVADPRMPESDRVGQLGVCGWDQHVPTITGQRSPIQGRFSIADPRVGMDASRPAYRTAGHYGIATWTDPSGAVTSSARHDNGYWNVADPRNLPAPDDRTEAVIIAIDGTWHRPFTTFELMALQSLVDPGEYLDLYGSSDSAKRERIGNAVPRDTAAAIGSVIGYTLLLARTGETFALGSTPIWVQPLAAALSVDTYRGEAA